MLQQVNVSKFLDPEKTASEECCADEFSNRAKDLMTSPKLWNMHEEKAGAELREILRLFTIYAPFEGRPFIRA